MCWQGSCDEVQLWATVGSSVSKELFIQISENGRFAGKKNLLYNDHTCLATFWLNLVSLLT
jgi:hypothetical protein